MGGGLFRDFKRLVEIRVLGKKLFVPENNTLLRAFQYVCPDAISYGRFCWNQECQFCRVTYQLGHDETSLHPVLACKILVAEGMEVTELADELKWTLKSVLRATNPL